MAAEKEDMLEVEAQMTGENMHRSRKGTAVLAGFDVAFELAREASVG